MTAAGGPRPPGRDNLTRVRIIDRLDNFQRRHRIVGLPLAIVYKFFEDAGMHLVATMAYYGLVASVPVAVVLTAVVDVLVAADPALREPLQRSLLGSLPGVGEHLAGAASATGGSLGIGLATLGAAYGGLGVAGAFQHAMNQVWTVPRNARPNPMRSRLRGLVILLLIVGSVIGSSIVAGLGGPTATGVLATFGPVLMFVINVGAMLVAMRYATAEPVRLRDLAPGAIIAGMLWPAFQVLSMSAVKQADTSTLQGLGTAVLALVALLHVGALVVVFCAELNVVVCRRLYPRALLTPFTDRVDLTAADRCSYAAQASAQRFKGYQQIRVEFADPLTGPTGLTRAGEADRRGPG